MWEKQQQCPAGCCSVPLAVYWTMALLCILCLAEISSYRAHWLSVKQSLEFPNNNELPSPCPAQLLYFWSLSDWSWRYDRSHNYANKNVRHWHYQDRLLGMIFLIIIVQSKLLTRWKPKSLSHDKYLFANWRNSSINFLSFPNEFRPQIFYAYDRLKIQSYEMRNT